MFCSVIFVEITLYCLKHQTSVYLVHIGVVDRIYRNCSCLPPTVVASWS